MRHDVFMQSKVRFIDSTTVRASHVMLFVRRQTILALSLLNVTG